MGLGLASGLDLLTVVTSYLELITGHALGSNEPRAVGRGGQGLAKAPGKTPQP